MDATSAAVNVLALAFSLSAVIVAVLSAQRQASDTRRTNWLIFIGEMMARSRTPAFREARDYLLVSLQEHNRALGVTRLPSPARDHIFLVGSYYQDLGVLVVSGVIDEDMAVAIHYTGIKSVWRAIQPYVLAEREHRSAQEGGGFFGAFEHLAVYTETVPYETISKRFPQRYFPPLSPS
ncbi:hypothetical protein ACFQ0X_43385 [Streptomyces rectiviolaceus]|uniref:Uncharacterized protein n=1 Tax=Streptomyces rectiviolaceus TaxID=332591 RepID=A0ABP6NQ48_9ACTN